MRALLLLPLQRLILSIRLRITEHLFSNSKQTSWKTLRISLIVWCICAWALTMYWKWIDVLGLSALDYTNTGLYPSWAMLLYMMLYIIGIVWLNWWLWSLRSSPKNISINSKKSATWWGYLIVKETILRILLLAWSYFFLWTTSIAPVIMYYLLVAASEEWLKRLSSLTLYRSHKFTTSDLILFALLVSLWFAFLENIIYMINYTQTSSGLWTQLASWSKVLITRWIVWFLVHMLFTWVIAYISLYSIESKKVYRLLGALIVGIWLHMSYNIFLYYNITIVIGFYLVLWYFWLSWLFYKSDGIYLQK